MSHTERVHELLGRLLPAERIDTLEPRDGLLACPLAAPASVEEAAEVLGLARAERWTVLPVGNGTKLGWARPPERLDLALSSRNLAGVLAYEPDDGTLTARAGTSWSALVAATRARHHLSPELPGADAATLGGVLGAGVSGFDRLRHGPLRHQVLGLRALHADGSLVKSGGRVVKNVTGYDLHRLWCGSQGTLCFLVEATLRLYPAPEAHALLRARCADLGDGLARCHALWRGGLQPVAVVLERGTDAPELTVVLAGREEAVASEIEGARGALGDCEVLRGPEAECERAATREGELRNGRFAPLTLACRPSQLAAVLARLAGAVEPGQRLRICPLLATVAVTFEEGLPSPARVGRIEEALEGGPARLHWRGLGARAPRHAPAREAARLMQRLKQSLDPDGLFAGGRFDGDA